MGKIFDVQFMFDSIPSILTGIPKSLAIALFAFTLGIFIRFIGAISKIYRIPVLERITTVYVSFIRGTPLLVQILLIYYGIPIIVRIINQKFGTQFDLSRIPAIVFMFAAFSLNAGAYLTETIRSAIQAVDKGQTEAAYSVGMSPVQAMVRIVIPQALKVGLPNFANFFIGMLKDTSLAFVASVTEIMGQAKIIAGRASRFFEAYIVAAVIYWIICILFEQMMRKLEARLRKSEKGVSS